MNPDTTPTLAYILKGYPRISETFISNEILLLEKAGFKMRLFPMRRPRENFCHDSVKKIKARVDYLPTELLLDFPRLAVPNVFCAVKEPKRYLRALGLAAERFQRTRKTATFKHLFQAGYMVQRHIGRDPSIVHLHGHFAHSPTSVTMFASVLSGLPFSFTAHAKDIYTLDKEQLRQKIAKAAFVATCTEYNQKYLARLAGDESKAIHCIYHGIDLSLFNSSQRKFNAAPPYQLLTVARMTEKKGLPALYRALKILAEQDVPFRHTLIGDGDDRDKILQLIKELKLENHCKWLGTQTHTQVLAQFEQSDLFILSCEVASSGDRDGIPNVIVESLAMGVPVVATNVSALPEIVIDRKTGRSVEPRNPDTLAAAILELLQDNELRETVIENGRILVQHSFDNKKLATRLADVFRDNSPFLHLQN